MEVSNPDKIMFPDIGLTKRDLIGYYDSVADLMLPHLAGRPLTLQRFPDGIGKSGFMQKHAPDYFPDSIRRVELPKSDGTVTHPMVDDADGLLYLANQGTVTFHITAARVDAVDRPDRLVIDLDPSGDDVDGARDAAEVTREVLAGVEADAGVMTTGSSGYHVVVRLDSGSGFDEVGRAARGIAELVAATRPERFTTAFRKRDRDGRVFIDWLRNRWAQTGVCPWSVRPLPGAPVAAPIGWSRLADTDPGRYTVHEHPDDDPLQDLPVVDTNDLVGRVADAIDAAGIDVDEDFDRFGRS